MQLSEKTGVPIDQLSFEQLKKIDDRFEKRSKNALTMVE